MFHLSPRKLWRNISLGMFIIAMTFTIIGTFAINDALVIHWNETGAPNDSTGKWILWAMLLLAFLSMFAHSSLSKECLGRNKLSTEMSGALSSGLVSMWTIINIILVTYNLYLSVLIPIIGTISIVLCYIVFVIIAYVRNRSNKS